MVITVRASICLSPGLSAQDVTVMCWVRGLCRFQVQSEMWESKGGLAHRDDVQA